MRHVTNRWIITAALLVALAPALAPAQPADPVAQARRALDAGQIDEALALLEKAVAAQPRDPTALAWLGNAQVRKAGTVPPADGAGWVRRGFNTLDEAVERFPDAFVVYLVRGATALRTPDMFRKMPVALADLGAVVTMKEKRPQAVPDAVMPLAYLNLGLAHKKSGQAAAARAAWEKGKALYPGAPEAAAIERELRGL